MEFLRQENTIMKNLCSESASISQKVVFIFKKIPFLKYDEVLSSGKKMYPNVYGSGENKGLNVKFLNMQKKRGLGFLILNCIFCSLLLGLDEKMIVAHKIM